MENDTALPNVVRFNVTVEHDDLTNAPAYDVKLTEGSDIWQVSTHFHTY